jgi:hypothetical protein
MKKYIKRLACLILTKLTNRHTVNIVSSKRAIVQIYKIVDNVENPKLCSDVATVFFYRKIGQSIYVKQVV